MVNPFNQFTITLGNTQSKTISRFEIAYDVKTLSPLCSLHSLPCLIMIKILYIYCERLKQVIISSINVYFFCFSFLKGSFRFFTVKQHFETN